MSDLDEKEQKHVRTALRNLRLRLGSWSTVAKVLPFEDKSLRDAMRGARAVTPTLAFRVARLAEASIDDLLAGRHIPGACTHCGRLPDFADETTIADESHDPRSPLGGNLRLVK